MIIPFTKMHGLGNDFVVIDTRADGWWPQPAIARAIADRRRGVGCDQILLLTQPENATAAVRMVILNADGTEAEACGNGTRCVAHLLMRETGADTVAVETRAGQLSCSPDGDHVTVDMGLAETEWSAIPLADPVDTLHLPVSEGPLADGVAVAIGNPHAVFFVHDAEAVDLTRLGPVLETHRLFPARANIEVCHIAGPDRLRMRVWERGVGITQACGSGACAAAVAAARRGLTGRHVAVELDGGPLTIEWRQDGRVAMTGPVATSFTGAFDPALLLAAAGAA